MGLLIMVAVSLLIAWVTSWFLGLAGGVVVVAVALGGWFILNMRSGTTGLFRANLKSYFAFRRAGQSVDEALRSMVEARYALPFQRATKERVLEVLSGMSDSAPEKTRVTTAVFTVFSTEHGKQPPAEQGVKYYSEISDLYDQIARRYGFSPK